MADDPGTGLDHMICFELHAAARAMTGLYRPALEALGLTYPQYVTMRVVWHRGRLTVRELGTALQLDSGTLSPLLKRLEHQGLIRRDRGTDDERTVWIHLSEDGAALQDHLAGLPEQIACAAGLTLDEFRHLHDLLGRFRANVTAD